MVSVARADPKQRYILPEATTTGLYALNSMTGRWLDTLPQPVSSTYKVTQSKSKVDLTWNTVVLVSVNCLEHLNICQTCVKFILIAMWLVLVDLIRNLKLSSTSTPSNLSQSLYLFSPQI